jgi:hypothetical protein
MKSGLRGRDHELNSRRLGGVVWTLHQNASSHSIWLPDTVDVLNIIIVKKAVQERSDHIGALLRQSYRIAVSIAASDCIVEDDHIIGNHQSFVVSLAQASRCHFSAIYRHYDAFSNSIVSLLVFTHIFDCDCTWMHNPA